MVGCSAWFGSGKRKHVDKIHTAGALRGKMPPQIAFMHGGNRMAAHRGMAIDPVGRSTLRGEKVPEQNVPPEMRRCHHNWDAFGPEDFASDRHRDRDIPNLRRTIEGGADLILRNRGAE